MVTKKNLKLNIHLKFNHLATEINELLEHNEKIVDRAKTHVGNLAHVLKNTIGCNF